MVQASKPGTDSSTGRMVLGVQCACRVIQWKDGDHSIEPCPLHAHADELLKALKAAGELWGYLPFDSGADIQEVAQRVAKLQRTAIEEAKS
ncbi:hypothetical protein LCGC14_2697250 [marine sediment metagenome]|uniref:Uncharacterized protein n=1 Tax=marine sediment metagenome TaxID=412755 RepID=A0A0F8ZGQ5_9ZZZZ